MKITELSRSTTFRLTMLYTILSLVSMLTLLGFIYWATAGYMHRQIDATINEEILGLSEQYENRGIIGLSDIIRARISNPSNRDAIYSLVDANNALIVGNVITWPTINIDTLDWIEFQIHDAEQARARIFTLQGGLHLLVGRNTRDLQTTRRLILEAFAWGAIFTVFLALLIGFMMSSRMMRRIEDINRTSREIMQGDLTQRINRTSRGDDLDQLADNLNNMLDRIEQLMTSVRQVSDNIAHDLRTPLTRLRTRLEQARSGDIKEIDLAIQDSDALLTTFNALLRIAQIESGTHNISFTRINIGNLIHDVVEFYEPVAEENSQQIEIRLTESTYVEGEKNLLFQMLANLLENAIKYGGESSHVLLQSSANGNHVQVDIIDSGPGIPTEELEQVFQRFYRCDASRSTPGNGLGLSLVSAIATMHQARIMLQDNHPGLKVSLLFPASPKK